MTEPASPLRIEYGASRAGLTFVFQRAPPGAASLAATYVGPAGWAFDPPGLGGLSRITNHLAATAAGPYDRVELARRLDRLGATLARQAAPESAEVTIWGPADAGATLLGLLADVVLRPRFDAEDLSRVRRQMRERQLRELTQPGSRADRELLRAIFPSRHAYATTGMGTAGSLTRIRRADLVRFHRTRWTSDGGLLIITAPSRRAPLERAAVRLFAGLPQGPSEPLRPPTPWAGARRDIRVPLPGNSQVEVRLGGRSIPRTAPEYPAAFLANEVLGGRPLLARLFQRVRERGGLAYHASSDIESMRFGGHWSAQAGTGAERWPKVVEMLRDEVGRVREQPVPSRELDRIRESAIGSIPLSLESTSEAHELAVDAAYYHLPETYWQEWPTTLRNLRPRQVLEAAQVAFDPASEVTVLAGPIGTP